MSAGCLRRHHFAASPVGTVSSVVVRPGLLGSGVYKPDRLGTSSRGLGDPRDMEDWCGAFLQGLDGLEGSPTAERPRAHFGMGGDASQFADRSGRPYTLSLEDALGGEGLDVLGKRARAPSRDLTGNPALQLPDGRMPTGPSGLGVGYPADRLSYLPMATGPYRSTSVHSVESTLSNQIDRHTVDDDDDFDLGSGLLRRSPPHKKGPASLPAAAPTLHRRAFSEGAQQYDDHDRWQRGAAVYASQPYPSELLNDSLDGNEWSMDNDDPSSSRAGQKTAPWTRTEDQVISEAVKRFGCKWGVLSALLPGRTDNAVRNRWHRLERARKWRDEMASRRHGAFGDCSEGANAAPPPPVALPASGPRNTGGTGYKCGRCGQPKRGHLCTVTLESDQLVYEQAQGKMRELHLQQADKRSSASMRRKQSKDEVLMATGSMPPSSMSAGQAICAQGVQGGPQPSAAPAQQPHAAVHQPTPPAAAPAGALAAAHAGGAPLSLAAQRQQAQRAQAQAQRQYQLAMQAQAQQQAQAQLRAQHELAQAQHHGKAPALQRPQPQQQQQLPQQPQQQQVQRHSHTLPPIPPKRTRAATSSSPADHRSDSPERAFHELRQEPHGRMASALMSPSSSSPSDSRACCSAPTTARACDSGEHGDRGFAVGGACADGGSEVCGLASASRDGGAGTVDHDAAGSAADGAPPVQAPVQMECLELLSLQIHPSELLHLQSLLGGAGEDEADRFSPLAPLAGAGEPHGQGGSGAAGASNLEYDPVLAAGGASARLDDLHYLHASEPPGLDRALSAPAGLLLDDSALGTSRWLHEPDLAAPLRPTIMPTYASAVPNSASKKGSNGEPSPTATAA